MHGFKYEFYTFFAEGLNEPPPQTPPRSILNFALDSGYALNSRVFRALGSGCALNSSLSCLLPPPN